MNQPYSPNYAATLTSLAMLKVNADVENQDYIDYLVPFVASGLADKKPDPVTHTDTRQYLLREYGLSVNERVCELVLRRLARQGYLAKQQKTYHIAKTIQTKNIALRRAQAEGSLSEVVKALTEFAETEYGLEWGTKKAESALVHYLSLFSIDCLRSHAHKTALPLLMPASEKELFITSSFIRRVREDSVSLFESVIVFVKGHMLANALICQDLDGLKDKFAGVVFYMDTPLILHLLGLEGTLLQEAARELVSLVKHQKGAFAIFEHTVEETHRVIKACEHRLTAKGYVNNVVREMRRQGKTPTDLAMVRSSLDSLLDGFGICKKDTPEYDRAFQIDERILESALGEEIRYMNPRAIHYDVNSIRSIYALRKGKEPTRLENCVAALVTSNTQLARVAFDYGRNMESSREVSSVITDFSLANIAWLKSPLQTPDLPQLQLMAVCYAAMEPKEGLWSLYLVEIDKLKKDGLVSPELHALLRTSIRAKEALMNLTLGSEQEFSPQTVEQIIESVKADLTREKDAELASERNKGLGLAQKVDELQKSGGKRVEHLRGIARKLARLTGKIALSIIALLLTMAVLVTGFWSGLVVSAPFGVRAIASLFLFVGMIFGLLNLIFGISAKQISRDVEEWTEARLLALLLSDEENATSRSDSTIS